MTLLYGNDVIFIENVKASLHSRELRKNVFGEEGEGQEESLFVRGKTNEKSSRSDKGQSRSKSKGKGKVWFLH